MASFAANPARADPYKDFKFRVRWGANEYVAGVSKVSALTRTAERVEPRERRDPRPGHELPSRTEYEPITLERGVTYDLEFEQWATRASAFVDSPAPEGRPERDASQNEFRRNLTIDVFDEVGQKVMSYEVHRAWVSEFTAQADLATGAKAILIQSIRIEHEGCYVEGTT
jgi:phage tail-like protein